MARKSNSAPVVPAHVSIVKKLSSEYIELQLSASLAQELGVTGPVVTPMTLRYSNRDGATEARPESLWRGPAVLDDDRALGAAQAVCPDIEPAMWRRFQTPLGLMVAGKMATIDDTDYTVIYRAWSADSVPAAARFELSDSGELVNVATAGQGKPF